MQDLTQWIKENHPDELKKITVQHKGFLLQTSYETTNSLERYLLNNYSMVIERSSHGFRIFWETRGIFISGRYQYIDMVIKEAISLTKWKPLNMITSMACLLFLFV